MVCCMLQGLANALGRQLLRTRRSFTATVFSADGKEQGRQGEASDENKRT